MKGIKKLSLPLFLLFCLSFLNGCYTVPLALAGAGLFGVDTLMAKEKDKMVTPSQVFEKDFQTVCQASLEVMDDLGIKKLEEKTANQTKGAETTIKGSTPRYKNITLSILALSPKATRVKVKVRDDVFFYRPLTQEDADFSFELTIISKLTVKLASSGTTATAEVPQAGIVKGEIVDQGKNSPSLLTAELVEVQR